MDRTLFERIGGFDPALRCWEISDFLFRASLESRAVAIDPSVYVIKHTDKDNSQFEATKEQVVYQLRFAHKLLGDMDRLPADQRGAMLAPVGATLYRLSRSSEFIPEFKALAERARRYEAIWRSMGKLCCLSYLPVFALRRTLTLRYRVKDRFARV